MFATTYYVDYDGMDEQLGTWDDGRDSNPGTSPWAPFRSIQRGIDIASDGDTVQVMPYGVIAQNPYVENLVVDGKKNLKIIGPWDPTPPPFPAPELDYGRWCKGQHVDGNAAGPVLRIVNSKRILVKYLVFRNGKADYGAGIQVQDSAEISFEDCCILENETVHDGGGIWARKVKKLDIRQCWVYKNKATEHADGGIARPVKGGGIHLAECEKVLIEECRIEENKAAFAGGGVFLTRTDLDMKRSCVFRNGVVVAGGMIDGGYGGGLALRGTSKFSADTELKSSNNVYKGNFVRPGNGGGIACYGLSEITRVIVAEWGQTEVVSKEDKFIGNQTVKNPGVPQSRRRGGAFMMKGIWSEATFENATFNENTADEDGGAAYFVGKAEGVFRNCTFTRNTAKDDGGALEVTGYAKLRVYDSTFVNNTASGHGGGGIQITTNASCTLEGQNSFTSCRAPSGGALHVRNAWLIARKGKALFTANEATTGDGGALYAWITKDPGIPGEAGVDGPCMVLLLFPHVFIGNIARGSGGAIAIYADKPPNITPYQLRFHLEGHTKEPVVVSQNKASTPDDVGMLHAGLWVYEAHPRPDTEIYIRRTLFAGHQLVGSDGTTGGDKTACAVIGIEPGSSPRVACWIIDSTFRNNHTSLLARKLRCDLLFLKIELSGRTGVAINGVVGRLSDTTVVRSGQVDVDLSQGSDVRIRHCELNGHSIFPGGLRVSADSHKSRISHSNIRGHTSFGVSFPWSPSGHILFAWHNYWGSAFGPHDPSNADGRQNHNLGGDFVSDGVDYSHYRKKPFKIITSDP